MKPETSPNFIRTFFRDRALRGLAALTVAAALSGVAGCSAVNDGEQVQPQKSEQAERERLDLNESLAATAEDLAQSILDLTDHQKVGPFQDDDNMGWRVTNEVPMLGTDFVELTEFTVIVPKSEKTFSADNATKVSVTRVVRDRFGDIQPYKYYSLAMRKAGDGWNAEQGTKSSEAPAYYSSSTHPPTAEQSLLNQYVIGTFAKNAEAVILAVPVPV